MKTSMIYAALAATPLAWAFAPPPIPGMKLTWSDSFAGSAGDDPNLDDWEYRQHLDHNNELQEYTDSNKNVQLSGGDTLQIVPWKSNDHEWTSGRLETLGSWNPDAGQKMRFQASLRMGDEADSRGMWPAFWLLGDAVRHGTHWPLCGEIDAFEQVNGVMEAHGTLHCGDEEGGVCNEPSGLGSQTFIPDGDFHDWAVEIDRTSGDWKTEAIRWMRDGEVFHTVSGDQIGDREIWATLAHSPFFMILNVAVGGNWPGDPDASTPDGYGQMMEVAYAAVYEST